MSLKSIKFIVKNSQIKIKEFKFFSQKLNKLYNVIINFHDLQV